MSFAAAIGILVLAGAVGGLVSAITSPKGLVLPSRSPVSGGTVLIPGFLGTVLVGAFAGAVNWGLYGPFTAQVAFGKTDTGNPTEFSLTVLALVTAALVGLAGSKWINSEVDKRLFQAAATTAASKNPDSDKAEEIMIAPASEALKIAQGLEAPTP